MLLRKLAILLMSLMLIILISTPPIQAAESWKVLCNDAYRLQYDKNWMAAWSKYQDAINACDNGDQELLNELRLDMATMQLLGGHLDAAGAELNTLKPKILTPTNRDSIQAMRLWRRFSDLGKATKNFDDAVRAQQNVLRIAALHFQSQSEFCLEEKRILMLNLTLAGRISEASKIAEELEPIVASVSSTDIKKRFGESIKVFFGISHNHFGDLMNAGKYKEAADVIHIIKNRYKTKLEYVIWLGRLRDNAVNNHSPEAPALVSEALQCSKSLLPDKEATEVYINSLNYYANSRVRNGKYDERLESLFRRIIAAYDSILSPAERNRHIIYIQQKCLFACLLAKLGKVEEAEKTIDSVAPSPESFVETGIFDAIYQARINGLADKFVERRDRAGVARQFRKMSELYKTMRKIPDRQKLLDKWKGVELEYLQRIPQES